MCLHFWFILTQASYIQLFKICIWQGAWTEWFKAGWLIKNRWMVILTQALHCLPRVGAMCCWRSQPSHVRRLNAEWLLLPAENTVNLFIFLLFSILRSSWNQTAHNLVKNVAKYYGVKWKIYYTMGPKGFLVMRQIKSRIDASCLLHWKIALPQKRWLSRMSYEFPKQQEVPLEATIYEQPGPKTPH